MYRYEEIRHVHLEITTRCNAACPMCARNARGRTAPGLVSAEISEDQFRQLFPKSLLERLTGLDICGAYGDPAVARDLLAIVGHVRSVNSRCKVIIYSNGGVRRPAWWKRLGELLGGPVGCRVVFGIDGLADTNSIYRRGVSFTKVIDNARAFIAAGGEAQWDFIVFRHNEHQVKAAEQLSKELGFRKFAVKKTARFLKSAYDYVPELEGKEEVNRFPIFSLAGEMTGYLEPPTDRSFVNPTALRYAALLEEHGTLAGLFSTTPICCRVKASGSVFVGAQGYTLPCCWTYVQATAPTVYGFPDGIDRQMEDLIESCGGLDRINALKIGLRSAVQSPLFEAIERSWGQPSVEAGRLKVCARVCGVEFPAFPDQFASPELVPGETR